MLTLYEYSKLSLKFKVPILSKLNLTLAIDVIVFAIDTLHAISTLETPLSINNIFNPLMRADELDSMKILDFAVPENL